MSATTAIINCHYHSPITCTSTPINKPTQDSTTQQPILPTKIILPNKKPLKWPTGVAPGDYGGPPTTTKLRKYWGGEKEDPLTSDELIWNRDFMPHMKRIIGDDKDNVSDDPRLSTVKEEPSGFLSFNRVMSLDSMDVDLSKELTKTSNPIIEKQVVAAQAANIPSVKWRPAPTRREQDKWDRATKAATGGSDVMFRELRKPKGDPKVLAAKSREQYLKLKKKLQTLTLAIGGVGLVSAYFSYTPEIAASFGAGLVGSLVYMRMLGNSMDGMAGGARGAINCSFRSGNVPCIVTEIAQRPSICDLDRPFPNGYESRSKRPMDRVQFANRFAFSIEVNGVPCGWSNRSNRVSNRSNRADVMKTRTGSPISMAARRGG